MKSNVEKIRIAIIKANNRKGYGDVQAVRLFADGKIEVDINRHFTQSVGTITTRIGHIDGNRVRFAGTSCVITG